MREDPMDPTVKKPIKPVRGNKEKANIENHKDKDNCRLRDKA